MSSPLARRLAGERIFDRVVTDAADNHNKRYGISMPWWRNPHTTQKLEDSIDAILIERLGSLIEWLRKQAEYCVYCGGAGVLEITAIPGARMAGERVECIKCLGARQGLAVLTESISSRGVE